MKLISVNASPFARKVRVLILELGLQDRVKIEDIGAVTPVTNHAKLNIVNPLGLIPALELDDGSGLYDSSVICEYLNQITGGPFYPVEAQRRYKTLGLQALANGILDLSVALRYELVVRPEPMRWPEWMASQNQKIERGLDTLETRCNEFESSPCIGEITVACALGYRDFRYADDDWRASRPALTAWFETMMQRESMRRTLPE